MRSVQSEISLNHHFFFDKSEMNSPEFIETMRKLHAKLFFLVLNSWYQLRRVKKHLVQEIARQT
jgi:hypothetical protein